MRRADRLAAHDPSPGTPGRGRGKLVAPAVVVSLGLHVALAVFLVRVERRPSLSRSGAVEIVITEGAAPSAPDRPAATSGGAVALREHAPSRTAARSRLAPRTAAPTSHASVPGNEPPPAQVASDAAAGLPGDPGDATRPSGTGWTTFLPARPDLGVAGKLGPPPERPRDLLAAPAPKRPVADPELPRTLHGGSAVTADVSEDGAIRFHDAKKLGYDVASATGHFDLTDAIMRRGGQDPYASAKRKLADDTREQRICMAKRAQDKRQSQALVGLATHVKQIARRVDLTPLERRQIVFEIWDECSEGRGDAAVDYGATARAIIAAVIREVFPAGSELGYSTAELASLNARRGSRDRFAPYDVKRDAGVAPEPRPADGDCP